METNLNTTTALQAPTPGDGKQTAAATPPVALSAGGSDNPMPSVTLNHHAVELQGRAESIFGRAAEVVHLTDDRTLGWFLDKVKRQYAENLSPDPFLAVQCGDGLCAIAIDAADDDLLNKFINANPQIRANTFWVMYRAVAFIFLRVTGASPPNVTFNDSIMWIRDGLVPIADFHVAPGSTCRPLETKGSSVGCMKFDDIVWPDAVAETVVLKTIEGAHGPLFRLVESQVVFGVDTAAHFFAIRLDLKYSPPDDTFSMTIDDVPHLLSKPRLMEIISNWLRERAALVGIPYPNDEPVKLVIDKLQALYAIEQMDEAECLRLYVSERLELKAGGSITTDELIDDYRTFCLAHGAISLPERIFYERVALAIRQRYCVCRSHSVRRPKPAGGLGFRTGYRGLALVGSVGAVGAVGAVGGLGGTDPDSF